MKEIKCSHKYIALVTTEQFLESETMRVGGGLRDIRTLERKIARLFCEKCGDIKKIE